MTINSDKELVVVSKTPEFFTYTLATIAVLLSIITLIVGAISGIGYSVIKKVAREKRVVEINKRAFTMEQKKLRDKFRVECKSMLEAFKLTVLSNGQVAGAKRELRDELSAPHPNPDVVYALIQKTISLPDSECLFLYGKALTTFETNINIIRIVRNGILVFSRTVQPDRETTNDVVLMD